MNLREEILREHSKAQTVRIATWIGNDPKRFARLATLFLEGEYRITQRAAWVISHCADSYPNLIIPHLRDLLVLAANPPHVAVKRNVLRVMTLINIPEDLEGKAYDLCYSLARQSKEDVAVRCHAMTILTTLAVKYPELKTEVCDIIFGLRDHDSPGLRSRCKKNVTNTFMLKFAITIKSAIRFWFYDLNYPSPMIEHRVTFSKQLQLSVSI